MGEEQMDNIQEPVAAVEQTQAQPTESQMPEVQNDGTASESQGSTGSTFEELAAKKGFKSADDLAKAYANLESHSTKVAQKASDIEREFFSKAETPRVEQRLPEDQALAELDKFVEQKTQAEIQKVRAEFEEREARRELKDVLKEHPDFGKYASEVKELKGKYPNMPFEEAYQLAKLQTGSLKAEAQSEAIKFASSQAKAQSQAQVAQPKPALETDVSLSEMLKNATSQVKINPITKRADPRSVAYFEQLEKQLFGQKLDKTSSGL